MNDDKLIDNKPKVKKTSQYKSAEVLILIISTAIICFISGWFLCNTFINKTKSLKKELNKNELSEIEETYDYILDNYYGEVDKDKLIKSAISGMLNSLGDVNTTAISDESSNNFNALLDGSYDGIGVEITQYGENIMIYTVFDNSPASKAGLKVGDIIKSINGTNVEGLTTSEVVDMIKQKNNKVKMIVIRDEKEIEVNIDIERVTLDSVTSKIINSNNKKIGYIYISIFAMNTYDQFKEQLEKLENEKIDSLIIDVRSNSGGHLTSATNILSLFLDSSKVIYQIEGKDGITKYYSEGKETKTYPVVVLVNKESASASEILASALKEQYNAKLVGEKTFGKGTVQKLTETTGGIQYKVTTQHWLTSNGNWIEKNGIDVDYEVALDEKYLLDPTDENDNQLQKAIDILK